MFGNTPGMFGNGMTSTNNGMQPTPLGGEPRTFGNAPQGTPMGDLQGGACPMGRPERMASMRNAYGIAHLL